MMKDHETKLIRIPPTKDELFALKSIREWLDRQSHLPTVLDNDILLFLHNRRYSVERTKRMINAYFTLRAQIPEVFTDRNFEQEYLRRYLDTFACVILPDQTSLGENVIIHKLLKSDANEWDLVKALKIEMAIVDIKVEEHGRVGGSHILFDCSGASIMHLLKFTSHFSVMKKIFTFAKVALPINIVGVHFINCNALTDHILIFLKPLLKTDLSGCVHFYGSSDSDWSKFHEFIPKTICPKDYGGEAPSIAELHDDVKSKLNQKKDFLKRLDDYAIRDSSINKPLVKTTHELEGSFKKLELD